MNILNESIRKLFQKVENHCISEIYKATDTVYYTEMSAINEWPVGGVQTPHLDTYSDTEKDEDPEYDVKIEKGLRGSSREWTCIVYLNDDHGGGETYFPPSDYYPMGWQSAGNPMFRERVTGDALLFQGIYHQHGVFPVRRCSRHTLSFWFTNDIMKSATQRPIENLDHNEYSVKKELITPTYDVIRNNYHATHRSKHEWRQHLLKITKK